jgi:hypothetical protein
VNLLFLFKKSKRLVYHREFYSTTEVPLDIMPTLAFTLSNKRIKMVFAGTH